MKVSREKPLTAITTPTTSTARIAKIIWSGLVFIYVPP
jgi:hypothetical protein